MSHQAVHESSSATHESGDQRVDMHCHCLPGIDDGPATLEDALAVAERPNIPNTTSGDRPNWSRALPLALHEIQRSKLMRQIGRQITKTRNGPIGSGTS